jgi:hypothetical protein
VERAGQDQDSEPVIRMAKTNIHKMKAVWMTIVSMSETIRSGGYSGAGV